MSTIREWLVRMAGALEGGLRVAEEGCLWCGAARRGAGDARSARLCPACAAAVPWIDRPACPDCGRGEPCPDCVRRKHSSIAASRSAVRYTPFMKEWLARYKYRGSEKLAPLFGGMAEFAYGQLRAVWREAGGSGPIALTYVPLSERRLEERGFNQAEAMARFVGRRRRVPVVPALVRTRHTEKQSYKSRRERLDSLDRAFAPDAGGIAELRRLAGAGPVRLVVVDDVYTTGSTLQHCGETLQSALGPENVIVYGLTWAR